MWKIPCANSVFRTVKKVVDGNLEIVLAGGASMIAGRAVESAIVGSEFQPL